MNCRQLVAAAAVVTASVSLAGGPARGHPGHSNRIVNISGNQFAAAQVSLFQQDTVVWVWAGPDTDHSVTADPGQAEQFDSDPAGAPGAGVHAAGDSFTYTFRTPGRYTYYCKTHPSMRGTVEVKGIDAIPPRIGFLRVRPRRFCRARGRRCVRPHLDVFLSENANISGQVERRSGGRWRVAQPFGLLSFPRGRKRKPMPTAGLTPGRYRLVVAARDTTGNKSAVKRVPFTVRRP